MPRLGSHSSFSTSWKPGSPMTNCLTIHSDTTSSTNVVVIATCFAARSSRRNKNSGISPASGMTTRSESTFVIGPGSQRRNRHTRRG